MGAKFNYFGRPDQGSGGPLRIGAMRRIARCNKGISSVEFVIILPLLMMFLFSIISFGSVLYIQANMENAAREAVRRLAVSDSTECTGTPPATTACPNTPVSVDCDDPITVGTAEDFACTYLANWQVDFEVEVFQESCPGREVMVTVTLPNASEAALADVFGFFDGRTLTADVTMREEQACI